MGRNRVKAQEQGQAAEQVQVHIGAAANEVQEQGQERLNRIKSYLYVVQEQEQGQLSAEQAAEQLAAEKAAAGKRQDVNMLIIVKRVSDTADQFKQRHYAAVFTGMSAKVKKPAGITEHLIATVDDWPMNERCTAKLGISKAKEQGFPPAVAIAAFNTWRSNYTWQWQVLSKSLVSLFKTISAMVKNDDFLLERADLNRALAAAEQEAVEQEQEQAAETLQAAITSANLRQEARAGAAAAEQAAEDAAVAASTIASVKDLTHASLSRVLESMIQLSQNAYLSETEQDLILAAADKLAARMQEQEIARYEAGEAAEQAAAAEQERQGQLAAEQAGAAAEQAAEQVKDTESAGAAIVAPAN